MQVDMPELIVLERLETLMENAKSAEEYSRYHAEYLFVFVELRRELRELEEE